MNAQCPRMWLFILKSVVLGSSSSHPTLTGVCCGLVCEPVRVADLLFDQVYSM